ncbi:MAG: SMC-Scp complex subunit ScpB [Woeseiaceae bacterium]|nr:SMC-Scp complex subunit ScpB [Woeseiaceae bacterium]
MEVTEIKYFVEAALLAAGRPLSVDQLQGLFDESAAPDKSQIREALSALQEDYRERGIEILEVASGYRIQVRATMTERLNRLWEERPPRYSRALFETLALIAYRQPMTRGEIEEIRGVSVSPNIIRSLLEREWVRVVGHRDVPGRPAMFGTTRQFLDYFGLKKLDDLPPLADLADWESLRVQMNLPEVEADAEAKEGASVTQLPVGEQTVEEAWNDAAASDADDELVGEDDDAVSGAARAALAEDADRVLEDDATNRRGRDNGDSSTGNA